MAQPAEKRHPATYADLEAVPEHLSAEIVEGTLYTFPRPAGRHVRAASRLGMRIGRAFDEGDGGPGGWWILDEPELHLVRDQPLVPDLAGWRVDRLPDVPEDNKFTIAPDWICEILSPSTERFDRVKKMPIYARERVQHLWLLDPIEQTLEVFVLAASGRWELVSAYDGSVPVRAEPFDAIELDLPALWAKPAR